jgi:hypothetical protein
MLTDHSPAKTTWFFPDTYLPDTSNQISHEALCVLNITDTDADLEITLYFEDSVPLDGFTSVCPSMRTRHIRLDTLISKDGISIPRCVPYSIRLKSNIPVLCQYTRLDATKPSYTLMTAMGL